MHYREQRTDNYIFPIYSEAVHITAKQKSNRLHRIMQRINEDLKEIARKCEINENLTTYVARHSAATILKHKGVSTTVISELLGHETESVTQVYLDSFESPGIKIPAILPRPMIAAILKHKRVSTNV